MSVTKPSVLITNLFLASRTGSELHILALSKAFKEAGWNVSCFTLIYAYPLRRQFESLGIEVITYEETERLKPHYDLLFAQQRIVSEYVWSLGAVSFDKVVISVLGAGTIHERPPAFYRQTRNFVFVSGDVQSFIKERYDLSDCATMVMPNYATRDYFDLDRTHPPNAPKRVAIVSNHPPQELRDLALLLENRGIATDILGYETKSVEITAELLGSYDIVISIGRTAQVCFAAGIPFYCYDILGGPGYIGPENIDHHAYANFSGRSEPREMSAEVLLDEVLGGYSAAVNNASTLRAIAEERYDFDALFKKLLEHIDQTKPIDVNQPAELAGNSDACRHACQEFVASQLPYFGTFQVFYVPQSKKGMGPAEDRSIKLRYRYRTQIEFELPLELGAIIRLDPDESPCHCLVESQGYTPIGLHIHASEGEDYFLTHDPIYHIEPATRSIAFTARPLLPPECDSKIGEALEQAYSAGYQDAQQTMRQTKMQPLDKLKDLLRSARNRLRRVLRI